jgi:hypothetical protein
MRKLRAPSRLSYFREEFRGTAAEELGRRPAY